MTDSGKGWMANSVRVVLFPSTHAVGLDIWRDLFGSEPDFEEVRSREGVKRQGGTYRSGQLEIVITPARIDIVASPSTPEIQASPIPSLTLSAGDFADELVALVSSVQDWLPRCGIPILRLAVSGTALLQADSVEESYAILADKVKSVKIAPGAMHDFIYRVNWRVQTKTSDIVFYNRLTTWSALIFGLQTQTNLKSPVKEVLAEHFACLELDINTPAERLAPLAVDDLVAIFNDLVYFAQEILENGECPTNA